MLGKKIYDPDQTEAAGINECDGMGLLTHETVFHREKIQSQTEGTLYNISGIFSNLEGQPFHGYEIHMGQNTEIQPPLTNSGNIYGTYIHGIFDDPAISSTIIRSLCEKKEISFQSDSCIDRETYKNSQYDALADIVRNNLDMQFLHKVINKLV